MRVLVVEDDEMIGRAVVAGLQNGGYTVDWVVDGQDAELALANQVYGLALLDLGLPRRNGLDILKALRRSGSELPVVVITARDAIADRVSGLDNGADDYLVKPFDLDELLARARAVVRRREGCSSPQRVWGSLAIDTVMRIVVFRGVEVDISAREFAVLEALMKEPGAVVSREKLEDVVYGWDEEVGSNSLEVHLHHLRRKLTPELIRNVRGVGYRIVAL